MTSEDTIIFVVFMLPIVITKEKIHSSNNSTSKFVFTHSRVYYIIYHFLYREFYILLYSDYQKKRKLNLNG